MILQMKTRVFLCNQEAWPYAEVQDDIDKAKKQLLQGNPFRKSWSCGNIKQIRVGERAYFYRVGNEPRGFFGYGRVIATERSHQTRLNCSDCQNLSEAYTDALGDLRISYEWYSVVDYDKVLNSILLRNRPEFDNYRFHYMGSGLTLKEEYVKYIDHYWKIHAEKYGIYTPLPIT